MAQNSRGLYTVYLPKDDMTLMDVMKIFAKFGTVVDIVTGKRNIFVRYKTKEEAMRAIENGKKYNISLDKAVQADSRPSVPVEMLVPGIHLLYTVGMDAHAFNEANLQVVLQKFNRIVEIAQMNQDQVRNHLYLKLHTKEETLKLLEMYGTEYQLFLPDDKMGRRLILQNSIIGETIKRKMNIEEQLIPDKLGRFILCFQQNNVTSVDAIKDDFAKYVEIQSVYLTKKYVFVQFPTKVHTVKAFDHLHQKYDFEIPRGNTARSTDLDYGVQDRTKLVGGIEVYVGNIPMQIDRRHLWNMMDSLGCYTPSSVRLISSNSDKQKKRFAFLHYSSKERAEDTVSRLNGHSVCNRTLRANVSSSYKQSAGSTELVNDNIGAAGNHGDTDGSNTVHGNVDRLRTIILAPPHEFEIDDEETVSDITSLLSDTLQIKQEQDVVSSIQGGTDTDNAISCTNKERNVANSCTNKESCHNGDYHDYNIQPVSDNYDYSATSNKCEADSSKFEYFDQILNAGDGVKPEKMHLQDSCLHENNTDKSPSQQGNILHENISQNNSSEQCDISQFLSKGELSVRFTSSAIDNLLKFSPVTKIDKFRLRRLEGPEQAKIVITAMLQQEPCLSQLIQVALQDKLLHLNIDQIVFTSWYDLDEHVAEVVKIKANQT